jgi:hypothetical protein
MSQQQLIDLRLRLQRKLSASTGSWCSGRVDSLALALGQVEQRLQARGLKLGA